jgi:predicted AAA+ superfamily ATPase
VSFEVYPLSFSEFLRFKGIEVQSELEYIADKTLIHHHFHDYLKYGGFPAVVLKEKDDATQFKPILISDGFKARGFRGLFVLCVQRSPFMFPDERRRL